MTENLHLEFVDEALTLVREAEAAGIRLRILGSIAYRLQCPKNLHLFDDMARVLTDVDFAAMRSHNRAIRGFMVARGYEPDEGVFVASEGARHIYLHPHTGLNVDVFADELYFCHRIPFKGRLQLGLADHLDHGSAAGEDADRRDQPQGTSRDTLVLLLEHPLGDSASGNKHIDIDYITGIMSAGLGLPSHLHHEPEERPEFHRRVPRHRSRRGGRHPLPGPMTCCKPSTTHPSR